MYNVIQYRDNYSKKSGVLWINCREELPLTDNGDITSGSNDNGDYIDDANDGNDNDDDLTTNIQITTYLD